MPHNSRSFLPANPGSWKMQISMNLAIPAPDGAHYNVFEELCIPFVLFRTRVEFFSKVLSDYDLPVFFGIGAKCTFISVNISFAEQSAFSRNLLEVKIEKHNGRGNIILISNVPLLEILLSS